MNEYPYYYQDAQGCHYPKLKQIREVNPHFAIFVSPDGKERCLCKSHIWAHPIVPEIPDHVPNEATVFADIKAFHEKFGLAPSPKGTPMPVSLREFRVTTLEEEVHETKWAESDEEEFDGLIDLIYFAVGWCYLRGWDFNEGWRRVHEKNMQKVRAEKASDSKRGSTFDVVKPPGWTPPDLSDLV